MISDILDFGEGDKPKGEVIVIGSGIAGAEISTFLARHGKKVILLESGREQFNPEIQALNEVHFLGKPHREMNPNSYYHQYLKPHLRGVSRVRQFGGTSNVWTGKWKFLQPSDFDGRDWIPESGWPIDFEDLLEHYRSATKDYHFGDLEEEPFRSEIVDLRSRLNKAGLKLSSFYWEDKPIRTVQRFGNEMQKSDNLHVILGATAVELLLGDSLKSVKKVNCKSVEGNQLTVQGKYFILAAGAFESARLLLLSDNQLPNGIGNEHDLVGRYYTDHPKHHTGTLKPGPLIQEFAKEFQYKPKPRFGICFALDDKTQREYQLLEHVLYLKPVYENWNERLKRRLKLNPFTIKDQNGVVSKYRVKFVTEQVPQKESRVTLGNELDSLGQRKLEVNWCFTEQDRYSISKTVELLEIRSNEAGMGEFEFGDKPPSLENMTDAAHQMGTTRMADNPLKGVVDKNCKVFGTDNLFIASSSVFPTGPSYSPTFTILGLSRRLGEHLLKFSVQN